LRGGGTLKVPAFNNFPALEIKAGAAAVLTPQFGLNPFAGIGTVSQLGQGQFHLGLEQGLHYPAFATQFPLEAFQVRGNPDLLPERFLDLRAGWLHSGGELTWQLGYSRKLSLDLIRWQRGNGNVYRPVNLDRALIQSLTGYFRYQIKTHTTCSGSLQLQDPRNRTAGDINEGLILPLRQLLAGYLRVSMDRVEYFGNITVQFGSRQYTLAANTSNLSLGFRDLDPYTLTSATLGRKLSGWELVLHIDNLFNQDLQRLERRVEPLRTFNFLVQRKF
jgi:outer membrane cobalamin receptor